MSRPDPLDRLLARGGLSAPEAEKIFANAYRAARRRPRRTLLAAGPVALAAIAVAAWHPRDRGPTEFSTKSAGAPVGVEIECFPGAMAACPKGASLVVTVDRPAHSVLYLHAYAERDGVRGDRIWYWPNAGAQPPRVDPDAQASAPRYTMGIGGQYLPGRYTLHFVASTTPLTRSEVLDRTRAAYERTARLTVTAP